MRQLIQPLRQYWKLCIVIILLASINQIFSLLDPLIFQKIIDKYALHVDDFTAPEFIRGVGLLLLATIGVAFVSRVAKNIQDYYLNTIVQRLGAQLYSRGVEHTLSLPYSVFEDTRSGETLNILQKARTSVETFLSSIINVFFVSLVGFLFVSIYALTLYWGIALVFIVSVPIIGTISYVLSRKIKTIQTRINAETKNLAGSTTESLRNIELVKSLGLGDQEIDRLNSTTEKILALELQKLKTIRTMSFIQGTCVNLLRAIIVFFMLYLIYNGTITYGQFFTLQIYSFFVFGPLQELGNVLNNYRDAQSAMEQYQKLIDTPPEAIPTDAQSIGTIETMSLRNIGFSYASSTDNALSDISIDISRGQTIAFVGPSGSGKTSLVKLITGLYQPTTGQILYNGIPHNHIALSDLRSQIGFVTQETQLFAGTIRENLLFVRPDATDDECMKALSMASANSIIERGTEGIDTIIGEGGIKVSGGERQRLSIARALLRNPSLLICDEATSALDSLTEEHITATIRDMSGRDNRITILIAHRLSTIMHADRIVVLEKGSISEIGTHDDLIAQKGLYYAMWRQQIGER